MQSLPCVTLSSHVGLAQQQAPNIPLRESALGKGRQEVLEIQTLLKPLQQGWIMGCLGLIPASCLTSVE